MVTTLTEQLERERQLAAYVTLLTKAAESGRQAVPSGAALAKLAEELNKSAADVDCDFRAVARYLQLAATVTADRCAEVSALASAAYERHLSIRLNYPERRARLVADGADFEAVELDRSVRSLADQAAEAGRNWATLEAARAEFDSIAAANGELFPRHQNWQRPQGLRFLSPDVDPNAPADFPTAHYGAPDFSPPPAQPAEPRRGTARPDRPAAIFLLESVVDELLGHEGTGEPHYFDDAATATASIDKQPQPNIWAVMGPIETKPAALADLSLRRVKHGNLEDGRPLYEDFAFRPPPPPRSQRVAKEGW